MMAHILRQLLTPRALAVLSALLAAVVSMTREQWGGGEIIEGRPALVDGDSFKLAGAEVRLYGIDAPEGRQTCRRNGAVWPCGEAARRELQSLVGSDRMVCRVRERDRFDRLLATCEAGGRNLNSAMVSSGYAMSFGAVYKSEEEQARRAGRGLWSGEFERPRDWRRQNGVGR